MLPATIATSVAPETISKVGRLFNGSAHDVLNELLQNARRAGATNIVITTAGHPADQLLHVVDDGSGIADPAAVVTLGRSGWSEETQAREDPAGMGVFSLAGRDVIIRSWSQPERQGWMAHIPAGAWASSRPIAISNDPIAYGTAITVRIPHEWSDGLDEAVRQVACHYPLPVTFNGEPVERSGWLDGAVRIEDWNGCRIGIYREELKVSGNPRLNFHGVTIACNLPTIGEVGRGHLWNARVDILDCPAIQLVLPARKEAVQNEALGDLRSAVTAAIFRTIAAQ
ncbi:MAG: ATP-binding protein, partial [Alphaproteobacteria bacterium]